MNASKKGNFSGTEPGDTSVQGVGVASAEGRFDLIETMSFDPLEGLRLLEYHLARMTASAEELGFAFDRHAARNELQAATFRLRTQSRVRLLLSRRRSEEHTSELQSLMRISYAVFCLKKQKYTHIHS